MLSMFLYFVTSGIIFLKE
uniref:Uncharacterized protein n=1 Tax=Anguilla anguilla TaxID=7936 RepID=A0A0E9RML6_ANGAN